MMQRIQHLSAVVGAVVVFVSLASPWWVVSSATSPTALTVNGFEATPALSALFLAACSAYGASLLSRRALRRMLSALHVALTLLAAAAALVHLGDPREDLDDVIGRITGLTGAGAWDSVGLDGPTAWVVVTFVGLFLGSLSGIVGISRTDSPPTTTKFDPSGTPASSADPVGTWDELSRGDDPTSR